MDAALKQRLVGASVIIALAVIFIPMIFDDSNRSQNQSISIKIPDEPTDLKHKILKIDSKFQATDEQNKSEENLKNKNLETKAPIQKKETIIEIVDNSKTKQHETNAAQKETPKTEKPVKRQVNIQSKKPVVVLKDDDTDSMNSVSSVTYRVKLGSFSLQKNAQQLKAKILNNGFKAFVEKDNATGLYKVFSNQVRTKSQADAMNISIQKLKLNIGKTSIEKLSEADQTKAELQLDSGWILQIGSFSSKENSLKLRDKIRKKGFISFVDEIFNAKKQRRYRVRTGPYATRDEAIAEKSKIKKSMNLKSLIKPHEKQRVINR